MLSILSRIFVQKVRSDYDSIAESFSETRQSPWKGWDLIKKYFDPKKDVLDIGCGNGRLSEFFKFKTYLGVDISKNLIGIAKEKYEGENVSFEVGDFLNLPPKKFDVVVSIAAFHHLPCKARRRRALKTIHKRLKKDGIFIFSVWNLLHLSQYQKNCRAALLRSYLSLGLMHPRDLLIPWRKGSIKRKRYYYAFKVKEVKKLLKNTDFELVEAIFERNGKEVALKDAHNLYFIAKRSEATVLPSSRT